MPINNPQGYLSPTELIGFEQQRSQLRRGTAQGLGQITFDRGLNNVRRTRSITDLTRTFNRRREGINASFANRGLLNSGIKNFARTDLRGAFDRGMGSINFESGLIDDQLLRNKRRLERNERLGLGDIGLQRQALQTENASTLELQ
jgi:hypothetical protein